MDGIIRITVVGDGNTGKTCMLYAYKDKKYNDHHSSTVFDSYSMSIDVDGKPRRMILTDTAGQEEYDRIRILAYKECDVFVLCYSVDCRISFLNVRNKWARELMKIKPNCRIILAATKSDLRKIYNGCVSTSEGLKLKKEIRANDFVECSSKLLLNVDIVFQKAVIAAIHPHFVKNRTKPKKEECAIL